jgi:large subunit ribosomal protein L4
MAELNVYDRNGEQVGKYQIDPTDLAPRINKQLLHDAVVMYQANARHGSSKTKSRSEVSGSTRKLFRQKGTGNARAGSRRSGLRRGGGHIHALRPRRYSYRLPRKALQLATRMAIASKIRDDEMVVIDDLALDQPRTREMASILSALGLQGTRTLVATERHDANIYKSARNIDQVTIAPVADLNALSVLAPQKMLVTKAALDAIRRRAEGGAHEDSSAEESAAER